MKKELPSIHYTCKAATAVERLPVYSWRVTYGRGGAHEYGAASLRVPQLCIDADRVFHTHRRRAL